MKRILLTLPLLALLCTLLLAGCAAQEASTEEPVTEPEPATVEKVESDGIAAPSNSGKLKVDGTQLVSEDGEPVQLKGVSTHGLAWFPQYVNEEFFKELREDWGANVVRLALYTAESGGYCTDGNKTELMDLVDKGVDAATDADLYVIVDWHVLSDLNPLVNKDEAIAFFDEVSKKYATNNNVIYEICNEPNGGTTWADIKTYAEEVIPVIRANDPDSLIIVGTPTWSQDVGLAAADPLDFKNVMYTLHFYAATHKDDLRNKMKNAVADGLPIFVTEYGICDASGNGSIDYESANEWVALMDDLNISYACWNLSNKAEASAIFNADCTKSSGFTENDLSAEGQWLLEILKGEVELPEVDATATSSSSSNSQASASSQTSVAAGQNGDVSWSIAKANSWESGGKTFNQYVVTVKNTSATAISNWEISIPFNESFELSDKWNGNYSANGSTLTVTNVDYNGTLAAGAQATDIGFIASGTSALRPL